MKLTQKIWLGVSVVIVSSMALDLLVGYRHIEDELHERLDNEARTIRAILMATRRVYHQQFLASGLPVSDQTIGFLPAHAMSKISAQFPEWIDTGLSFNNVSDQPRNPANQADAAELAAMNWFRKNPSAKELITDIRDAQGRSYYHFTAPIWTETYCLKCHGDRTAAPDSIKDRYAAAYGYKSGDLRGVMSIKLPQDELRAKARHIWYQQYGLRAGGYLVLLLLLGMLMQRLVMRPLRLLEGVVNEFGSGSLSARTMLSGSDEISHLAQSFDQMAGEVAGNSEVQRRLNRELRAISNCNQSLMRATDEQALLNTICRIVCDEAGYRMAWVGYAEHDEAKTIRPVAWAGVENGYIEQARLTWADTEHGRGPAGTAIRSGQSACIQDFATESKAAPWREMALERGYRSAITFPLKDGNTNTFGILTIYSTEPNAFTPEEIRLLGELAGDLAFGIVTIRARTERKQLEGQKEQYLRFFMLSTEAMCIADPFGCFKQVNPALVQLTGYSESELVAKPFLDFIHPDDRQRTADEMKLQVAVRPSMQFENRYVCKDGSVILLSWTAYFDKGDGITYATARDITESRKLEEAIAANEKEFRLLAEAMPQIVWVTRPDGWNTYFNQQWVEYTGLTLEESYGHGWNKPFHPDDQQRAWAAWQNAVNNNGIYSLECRLRRADGVYRWWLIRGVPVFDEHGKIYKWFGTCTDIDNIKQVENKLRAATSYTRSLIEASLDPLVTINNAGKITDVNEATVQATGVAREALIGRDFAEFFTEPDKAREGYQQVFAKGQVTDYPLALRHRNGHVTDVLYNASVYRNEAGEVLGVFAAARDVTERKRIEDALRYSEANLKEAQHLAKIGSWNWDIATDTIIWSEEYYRIYGVDPAQCPPGYEEHLKAYTPESAARLDAAVKRNTQTGEPYELDLELARTEGPRRWVTARSETKRDAQGQIIGLRGTVQDITERKQAEQKLHDSERRLQLTLEATQIGVWDWNVKDDLWDASPTYYTMLGYEPNPGPADRQEWMARVHPEDIAEVNRKIQNVLSRDCQNYCYEARIRHANGNYRWQQVQGFGIERDQDGKVTRILGIRTDINERKQGELTLERTNRALHTLSACNEALVHATNETELLDTICRLIVEKGGYRMAWVGFAEQDSEKTVRPVAYFGHEEGFLAETKRSWAADSELGRGPVGTAIRTGAVQVNQNTQTDPALALWREAGLKRGYQSGTTLPLQGSTGILGALTICAPEPDAFNETEVTLLQELAADLAFGIETLRTRAERDRNAYEHEHHQEILRNSLEQSIQAIAATVEARDPYTAGHQQRVTELAEAIAREMGLAEERIHGMRLAASIHDLGKIKVPAEILAKPGKLTALEFMLIKTHPQAGYDILKDIEFPWPIADIVRQHHERLDGSGYPQGLKDGQVLLESRILSVADVVEAMSSHRPYRPSLGIDAALEEIERRRGVQYDSKVVDACIKLFRERDYELTA